EQSLRSAPSGRNSEQGLAPRSKYSRRYAAEYFGHRKSWVVPAKQAEGFKKIKGTASAVPFLCRGGYHPPVFLQKGPLVKGEWFWLCQNRGDSVEITG
ncbi:MAG: hypothetical protein IJB66_02410, partial [Oscillospiraceae bacterium]|nr:hypothetical protein [Oscillospiraceae bacterium]